MTGQPPTAAAPALRVECDYTPAGDQPAAIEAIAGQLADGAKDVVLLGATGTGKSATCAWVLERLGRPALVLEPNKTLAAQMANELRELLPHNAVEYFVSYYDYYQPEAYVPQTDTFIEKDAAINAEVERLRHAATEAVLSRRDTVIVATVSAIYGLGTPATYRDRAVAVTTGTALEQGKLARALVDIGYTRNDTAPERAQFRVRGDTIEIRPPSRDETIRVELFGDDVERISVRHPVSGAVLREPASVTIYPASHYVTDPATLQAALVAVETELAARVAALTAQGRLLEAQRLAQRTSFDLEMIRETGSCAGIENYSRHLDRRAAGTPGKTLIDFFPDDFLLVVDESHVTIPQLRAMSEGDAARKRTLIEHGFRLPSAADNRPLTFAEFTAKLGQTLYLSATPGPYELERTGGAVVEQVIRPTGVLDPRIVVKPTTGQVDDLLEQVRSRAAKGERVLVTVLAKKLAEDLTDYLLEHGARARYLHSDIDTLRRVELLAELRAGEFDCLVGVNLLREGLDLPEVSLVAVLDADKEGFLRSATALIQTVGRAARNVAGEVHLYADTVTPAMARTIEETARRRDKQAAHNATHGQTPAPLRKPVPATRGGSHGATQAGSARSLTRGHPDGVSATAGEAGGTRHPGLDTAQLVEQLTAEMHAAAAELKFELAARLRDEVRELRKELTALRAAGVA